jgi:hypothetical protein
MRSVTTLSRLYAQAVWPAVAELAHLQQLPRASAARRLPGLLKPKPEHLQDPSFAALHVQLSLAVALRAVVVLCQHDAHCRAVYQAGPKGLAGFQQPGFCVVWLELGPRRLATATGEPPRALDVSMVFSDTATAVAAVQDRLDAMAAVASGRIKMDGYTPLADRVNQLMASVQDWLS